jgi:hypothetical protein
MSAWTHTNWWQPGTYSEYRRFVSQQAPQYRGQTADCADISLTLLVDFASQHGLPLTFWDNSDVRYISKGTRQTPKDSRVGHTRTWSNKADFLYAVKKRIGAKSLLQKNTMTNPSGPQPGDLMSSTEHAALVFAVRAGPGAHPRAADRSIAPFPGDMVARTQLNQTEYFRTTMSTVSAGLYIDYLNHRGYGKEKAELIYEASVAEIKGMGFDFRAYHPGVLDNWLDWDGLGDPPR